MTRKIFLSLNLIAAILLALAELAPYISPAKLWVMEFIALSYPILVIINLLFVIFWAIQFNRYVFISAAVIVMGLGKAGIIWQPALFRDKVEANEKEIYVMSYNVRLFDLYNWTGNKRTRARIMRFLDEKQPDIICFQEYYTSESPQQHFSNNDTIAQILENANRHIEYGISLRNTDHWGLATFSKYPILHREKIVFDNNSSNFGMFTDVLIGRDTIRIYNVHLQSNHFRKSDYEFLEHPDSGDNQQFMQGIRDIARRMKRAAVKRAGQVDELKAHLNQCPYPFILCGDLNAPPFTYAYRQLSSNIDDAFLEQGQGFGITYFSTIPPVRIDYLLHSKDIQTQYFEELHEKYSDHYPIEGRFVLRAKKAKD